MMNQTKSQVVIPKTKQDIQNGTPKQGPTIPLRSEGDGMESQMMNNSVENYQRSESSSSKPKPEIERSVICKQPKFIPYEPYRAAINPIVPCLKKDKSKKKNKAENNMGDVASDFDKFVGNCHSCEVLKQRYIVESSRWETQKEEMLATIKLLRQENKSLEGQLDVQTGVNKDVKKLLIASIGEDLSARVQFLTEDKLKLAQNILHYSEDKVKDTELVEKFQVECDVWRSKFWALSMMVDELAHWKASLSSQLHESHSALRNLLSEQHNITKNLQEVYSSLRSMQVSDSKEVDLPKSKTLPELAAGAQKLVSNLLDSKGGCGLEPVVPSLAEKKAMQIISQAESNSVYNDMPPSVSRTQCPGSVIPRFHMGSKFEHLTFYCCPHCKGEISVI